MTEYKYQHLFEEHQLTCESLTKGIKINSRAYRWVVGPIDHNLNFLPNILYDIAKSSPRRINSLQDQMKCGYCALSFFTSKDAAINKYKSLPTRAQSLIGYNHIAEGELTDNDGVISEIHNDHFNLFEYISTDLKERFVLTSQLI